MRCADFGFAFPPTLTYLSYACRVSTVLSFPVHVSMVEPWPHCFGLPA